MGETRNVYRIFVRKPLGKLPFRRQKRSKDNIKMDIREIICEVGGGWK
jgi:hypothetical protein